MTNKSNFSNRTGHIPRDYSKYKNFLRAKERYGFKEKSLIDLSIIPLKNIIICTLHLRIRIFYILLNNLISQIAKMDSLSNGYKIKDLSNLKNFSKWFNFLEEKCKLKIKKFNAYNPKKAAKLTRDFTGVEIKTILNNLNLENLFPDLPKVDKINTLWQDFNIIDKALSSYDSLNQNRKEIIDNILSLGEIKNNIDEFFENFKKTYQPDKMTPYFHILTNHVIEMLENTDNINIFSQQGLEKVNDITTTEFFFASNKKTTKNTDYVIQILFRRMRIGNYDLKHN